MDLTKNQLTLGCLTCFFVAFLVIARVKRLPQGLRLPPGPRGIPLIGNVMDLPSHHQWETFSRWARQYGNLVHIRVLGVSIVIVNSLDVAYDLFERRSSVYSDRYDFPMLSLMGWETNLALIKYGARWRKYRKTFLRGFHPAAVKAYYPIQTKWTRGLLERLRESPEDFSAHLRHHSGAIIMDIVYGIQVQPSNDPYLKTAEGALSALEKAANPGSFLIDLLPCLKYLPEWVPGAAFKRKARMWRTMTTEMVEAPYGVVKKNLDIGDSKPSVTKSLIAELYRKDFSPSQGDEEVVRHVVGAAFAGGSDTTTVALSWFLLAMVLYPNVQRKAQAELDNVLGMDRLPSFDDREKLPYIDALCKEIQRWNPVVPIGVAHAVSRDDIYKNYFIPGGSIVIGNVWAMLRDEKAFGPRPDEFEPERFLSPGTCDPRVAFGYGQRMCPGRHMGINTIFIAVASILKVFNISHAKDCHGNIVPVKASCTTGTVTRPEDFQCSIMPRSKATENLLMRS